MANHPAKLTRRQRRFVEEYLVDLNATQAAIRAGYSSKSARLIGSENLTKPDIQTAIQNAMAERSERCRITQDDVLMELAAVARADMANFLRFSDNGDVYLDLSNLPAGATKLIREITQEEYVDGKGEGARTVKRTRLKLHDKLAALKLAGQHLGMFRTGHNAGEGTESQHVKVIILDRDDEEEGE